jgi:hypothetical protein
MRHLNKFNESTEASVQTLRDIIGDVKGEAERVGYYGIYETTKGCFTNIELSAPWDNYMDREAKVDSVHKEKGGEFTGEVLVKSETYWMALGFCYLEVDSSLPVGIAVENKQFKVKILSLCPGDERGCVVFNNTFICSGHDGSYLWNINNPKEFYSHTF